MSNQEEKDTTSSPHVCTVCGQAYQLQISLKKHLQAKHNIVDTNEAFVSVNKELSKYCFSCTQCSRAFPRKHLLEKHMDKEHINPVPSKPKVEHTCNLCNKTFNRPNKLTEHMTHVHRTLLPTESFTCPECQQTFARRDYLRKHMKTKHTDRGVGQFVCGIDGCTDSFHTNQHLLSHQQSSKHPSFHALKPDISCEVCGWSTKSWESMNYHKKTHGPKSFSCNQCEYVGLTQSSLNQHTIRKHTTERRYACDICQKSFNDNSACKRHRQTHDKSQTFACSVTDCTFTTQNASNLQQHIRNIHTRRQLLPCKDCSFQAANTQSLKKHMLTHQPGGVPRPFACPWDGCDATFSRKTTLTNHYRIHSGEKPFMCPYDNCNSAFADSSTLKKHVCIHTNDKRFVCNECGFATIQSHTLKQHMVAMHSPSGMQRQKKSEYKLFKTLQQEYKFDIKDQHNVNLVCDQTDATGQKRAAIDFVTIINGIVHFIENDENQHSDRNVSCECTRMLHVYSSLSMEGNTMPVMFWRFNPHGYKVNRVRQKPSYQERVQFLVDKIKEYSNKPRASLLPFTIHYVCYTSDRNVLDIINDVEFVDAIKPCVVNHVLLVKTKK
jgi:uncharacterized Zn-finger protein